MKTSIKNLFTATLVMFTLSSATVVANATENNANYTAITMVKNINKIVVSGNVKLILIQDVKEGIEVYDQYYTKNALIQQQGATLRISSFEKNTLTVIAHVNNLNSIEALNTATVSTAGKFNLLNLSVVLGDDASADLNVNTVNLTTDVNDSAALKLEGSTQTHQSRSGITSKIETGKFIAQDTNTKLVAKSALAKNNKSRYDDLQVNLLEKLF